MPSFAFLGTAAAAVVVLVSTGDAMAQPAPAVAQPAPVAAQPAPPANVPQHDLATLRKRLTAPGDHYADLGGVEIRYRDEGKGQVLVLLHGSSSTLNAWDGVVARLKNRYRIIRYDAPPSGLSGPVSDAAIKAIGAPETLVARLLDKLGVDKAAVFGTSSGGTLAYYFAATYPDRVTDLILSNTPADSVAEAKITPTPVLEAAVARAKQMGYKDQAYWRTYLSYLYGDPARLKQSTIDYYYQTNLRVPEKNPFGLYALTANKPATAAHLAAVKAPVLILWGMRDPVLAPPADVHLYDYLANARSRSIVRLETVGHYPPLESPDHVADIVDGFLNRNR